MSEVSIADVDQAEARLAEAKDKKRADEIDPEEFRAIKNEVNNLRQAWRRQEEAAGRRGGFVGGDAVATPSEEG
jgi:hypothetical protein